MSVFVSTCSSTAHRPFGCGTYIGSPSIPRPAPIDAPDHRTTTGTPSSCITDRQAEAVAEMLAERARRAIWANCERRPLAMDRELT